MRRVIIGLIAAMLAGAARADPPPPDAEGVRLLAAAISAAQEERVDFRLRCAFGCSRARATLSNLSVSHVTASRKITCGRRERTCYQFDLERKSPMTQWFTILIETRNEAPRPIARVDISGP